MAASVGFSRRTSPAFAVGGLGYEPIPERPQEGWNIVPFGGWICFHCAERFPPTWAGQRAARRHFGAQPSRIVSCLRDTDLPLEGC